MLLVRCLAETADRAATLRKINRSLAMSARAESRPFIELVEQLKG